MSKQCQTLGLPLDARFAYPEGHPLRKKLSFVLVTLLLSSLVAFALGELIVRWTAPVSSLHPRYAYSREYGIALYPSTVMSHAKPGSYAFTYTVNRNGFRGPPFDETGSGPVILCLGDSFTFGQGVNDGQEWVAYLRDELGDGVRIVNRGVPGWGLGQEIRKYVEFSADHAVDAVVLQFCGNDPKDGLYTPIATVGPAGFEFHDDSNAAHTIKRCLSRSWIQKSQFYNFMRQWIFTVWRDAAVANPRVVSSGDGVHALLPGEEKYLTLLRAFVDRLETDGVPLIVVSATRDFGPYSRIRELVRALDDAGRIRFVDHLRDVSPGPSLRSPEGHWGPEANRILARQVAEPLRRFLESR